MSDFSTSYFSGPYFSASMLAWSYLLVAGLLEVGFTTLLKQSLGFTRLLPSIAFIICASASFCCLHKATLHIPMGTAYAVWTGIGVLGTVLVQALCFDGSLSASKLLFMAMLLAAIVGLKMSA